MVPICLRTGVVHTVLRQIRMVLKFSDTPMFHLPVSSSLSMEQITKKVFKLELHQSFPTTEIMEVELGKESWRINYF